MSDKQAFYRSTAPDVLAWLADFYAKRDAFVEQARDFAAPYPDHEPRQWSYPGGSADLLGLSGRESPGPDWREDRGVWVPRKSTKAGKVLAARMNAIRYRVSAIPGMPYDVVNQAASLIHWPQPILLEGALWVTWSCPLELVEADARFDPALWERVKASAYYLAREAAEEEHETNARAAA